MSENKLSPRLLERARALKAEAKTLERHWRDGGIDEPELTQKVAALHERAVQLKADADDESRPLSEQLHELSEQLGFRRGPAPTAGAGRGHEWAKALLDYHARAVGPHAKDNGLVPSGSIVVALPAPPVVQDAIPVRRMRQLLRTDDAPGGHYRYLEQTVREWAAAEVEIGAQKPESKVGLELREGQAPVVATVSEPLDRFMLSDAPALQQFVGVELREAVEQAIEAAAVAELDDVGMDEVELAVDVLTTARMALATLEDRTVVANGFLMNPWTWANVEVSRTTTEDWQLRPDAPVNTLTRRLWGVPVVTAPACPRDAAYVGDWGAYARFFSPERGQVRLDWSENVGDDFTKNQVRFRAETRNKMAVLLDAAFVKLDLSTG